MSEFNNTIIKEEAHSRLQDLIEREQLPADVRTTLASALQGDMRCQQIMFQAMMDTWPRLQKCISEVQRAARKAPWRVKAWSERGDPSKPKEEKKAKMIERTLWGMSPNIAKGHVGIEGIIESATLAYFTGHEVMEILWHKKESSWAPKCANVVPSAFYGYPYNGEDQLMLKRSRYDHRFTEFPENKFILCVNKGHSAHAAQAAPLRALSGYWLAAVYGLKWLMNFSQIYGIPMRWATYSDDESKVPVSEMLRDLGASLWGAFPKGTELNIVDSGKSAQALPQRELIKMADEQCEIFILGQNLTSSQDGGGSRALGEVHHSVRQDVIEGVCDFVGRTLTDQLVKPIVKIEFNDEERSPEFFPEWEESKNYKEMAERDSMLLDKGIPMSKEWFYDRHDIPMPSENEELINGTEVEEEVKAVSASRSEGDRLSRLQKRLDLLKDQDTIVEDEVIQDALVAEFIKEGRG